MNYMGTHNRIRSNNRIYLSMTKYHLFQHFQLGPSKVHYFFKKRIALFLLTTPVGWKVHKADGVISTVDAFFHQCNRSIATPMEEVCGSLGELLKNKPHLVTFHESILVILWTFGSTLVFLYSYHSYRKKNQISEFLLLHFLKNRCLTVLKWPKSIRCFSSKHVLNEVRH